MSKFLFNYYFLISNEILRFCNQVKQMSEKDDRIKIINEVLNGIKVLS